MLRTKVTPPSETAEEGRLWYTKFTDPSLSKHRSSVSSASLHVTLSMQPMEILPTPFFVNETSILENALLAPSPSIPQLPDAVPSLVAYSSHETDESANSRWGTTQISSADGKKVSMYTVAKHRLRVQTDNANISCKNGSNIAESVQQSPPILGRTLSEISRIPVRGGDTICSFMTESDDEDFDETAARFEIPDRHRLHPKTFDNSRRVSEARSEVLEKYRGKLTTRLEGIMLDFDSKIDGLISAAKNDFASLKRDLSEKSARSSRRASVM